MSSREIRSSEGRDMDKGARGLVDLLLRRAGRVRGGEVTSPVDAPADAFEALENRILLGGDHPSFVDVFPPGTQMPDPLTFVGDEGTAAGIIDPAGDDDMFRFTATDDDFVTVWADAINNGATLDTEIRIYDPAGAVATTPIFTATDNGTLKDGLFTDAWVGFVAEAGKQYYVQVMGENGSTGNYSLRVDLQSSTLATGFDPIEFNGVSSIDDVGADEVFMLPTPDDDTFDSVVTANATTLSDGANFDSRIEIFDSSGNLITEDSETGRLTMGLAVFESDPNETYYLRVRSDVVTTSLATGNFTLAVDATPTVITVDDTNRRGSFGGAFSAASDTQMFSFVAQGTGLMVSTAIGSGFIPLADPTLTIFDADGNQLGVADDNVGLNPQMEINLTGGETYFLLLWGVDLNGPGEFSLFLEPHTTYDQNQPVDDHVGAGQFALATPLRFSDPFEVDPPDIDEDEHPLIVNAVASGRIHDLGDNDLFMFTVPWGMAGNFAGFGTEGDPDAFPPVDPAWYEQTRPSSKATVVLSGTFGGFTNMFIEVFDSQFNSVYTNDTIAPPFPDPAGMIDPAITAGPPDIDALDGLLGIDMWMGETYYILVSAGGTGRYNLSVSIDAFEEGQSQYEISEITDAGDFPAARQIVVNGSGTGDATNFIANMPIVGSPNNRFYQTGPDGPDPAMDPPDDPTYPMGLQILEFWNYAAIESPDDTDLYFFTAPATGTAEVWINTTNITDEYYELHLDPANFFDPFVADFSETKLVSSQLDSTLKIYNNNTQLIGETDDNPAMQGGTLTATVGTLGTRDFQRRDARMVFSVIAGNRYYIEVGSAEVGADPSTTNRRGDTGKYELLINTMPDLNFDDDHSDSVALGTVIPFDATAGTGTVTGRIDNTFNNPVDVDFFEFYATGTGLMNISVAANTGQNVLPDVTVFDGTGTAIAAAAATSSGVATLNVSVDQGEKFFISVIGAGNTEGTYTISLSGIPHVDDHADALHWDEATTLTVLDFAGTAQSSGSIEAQGDTDLFVFTAAGYDFLTATVAKVTTSFNPFVRIYEVHEDGNGDPVFHQISFNDDFSGTNTDAIVGFSVTPDHLYYVAVSGSDPDADRGDYNLSLAFDPTDDHADLGQEANATPVVVNPANGEGQATGILEDSDDDDLFSFVSPASGSGSIFISGADDLNPSVEVFDSDGNSLAFNVAGTSLNFATVSFAVTRGAGYFVVVDGNPAGVDTGSYTIAITAPPVDDHANAGDFAQATTISLNAMTGAGAASGEMGVPGQLTFADTDLFQFLTLVDGLIEITISTPNSNFTPTITIYDGSQTQIAMSIDGDVNDEDGSTDGSVTVSFTASDQGLTYFIEVGADGLFVPGSAYDVSIVGPEPSGDNDGPDDYADSGDFDNAGTITLGGSNGDGNLSGQIESEGDTDLFSFTSLAVGKAFVQVITPKGSLLDVAVRIFGPDRIEIPGTFNAAGVPGINALATFTISQVGQPYYVEVSGLGSGVGTYEVRIDTPLATFRLFYPEGFGGSHIREYVSLSNANTFDVQYVVKIFYEDASLTPLVLDSDDLGDNGIITAGKRGGLTLSDGAKGVINGLETDTPYSIVIESDGPLGATLSHYDFGLALGESFTSTTSSVWAFARAERNPGAVNDFVVFHNPNDHDVTVTLTAFLQGNLQITLTQDLEANRRGGFNLDLATSLPVGTFSVVVSSAAIDPADDADHIGIVAGLSHYDTADQAGYAILGDPSAGATRGVIPSLTNGTDVKGELRIFNPGTSAATVNITASYLNLNVADVTLAPLVVSPRSFVVLTGSGLQLIADQPAGLRYTSDSPVTVLATQEQEGDADATAASTTVGMDFFFGDAFINTLLAGTSYFENLNFYNPANIDITVDVTFFFTAGQSKTESLTVGADGFATLALHTLSAVLDAGGLNFYSMEVTSGDGPFAVNMTHYDLFLGGGFGTGGAPLGLINALSEI